MDFSSLPTIKSIHFQSLTFAYEGHEPIFQNVDFIFPTQNFVWINAGSGAGRSSLLQLLAGLQLPTQGGYYINDQNVTEMSFEEFLPYRLSIGYSFDFGGLINNRTLLENCTLPLLYHKICSAKEAEDKVKYYFERMGFSKHLSQRPSFVPGGVRKLTCLLRALIMEPQILLLDDPSVGLGQDTILKYFELMSELHSNGRVAHVFISSFDEKFVGLFSQMGLPLTEICIEKEQIFNSVQDKEKRVANL